jgi:hypothetical protein
LAPRAPAPKIDLKVLIEQGTPDEKKQFIRTDIASIEVVGKNRKIRVGYYDPGEDVALRVMPPTALRLAYGSLRAGTRTPFAPAELRVLLYGYRGNGGR